MEDIPRTVEILDKLAALGLELAIDDFGTGYSSLSALQQFPIKTLKIDRSFVTDAPHDENDAAIVQAIVDMSRSLRLDVVAEGIETQAQFEFLRRLHCDYGRACCSGSPWGPSRSRTACCSSRTVRTGCARCSADGGTAARVWVAKAGRPHYHFD